MSTTTNHQAHETATTFKAKGNEHYSQHNHALAIAEYTKAINVLVGADSETTSDTASLFSRLFSFASTSTSTSSTSSTSSSTSTPKRRRSSAIFSQPPPPPPKMDTAAIPNPELDAAGLDLLASLHSNRCLCWMVLRDFDRAWVDANSVIRLKPGWVKGYFRRADVFLRTRRYQDALSDFEEALKREPENISILERIHRTSVHVSDINQGLLLEQVSVARGDICQPPKSTLLAPIQTLLFQFAASMRNFIYFVGDIESRQVIIVDACWDIDGLLALAQSQNLQIVACAITHYHVDHCGGIPPPPYDKYGVRVDGLVKLLKKLPSIKAYVHGDDVPGLVAANPEVPVDRIIRTQDGTVVTLPLNSAVPKTRIEFIHTPGHTPGSQCLLINGTRLLSGDTLFIKSCGRCDFPDSSAELLEKSLEKLSRLDPNVIVLPGHDYGGEVTSIAREKEGGLLGEQRRRMHLRKSSRVQIIQE